MQFRRYSSIENVQYTKRYHNQIPPDSLWCVNEKIHGANFQLTTTDGKTVKAGKRSDFLTQEELKTFYGAGEIIEKYKDRIILLFEFLNKKNVTVYGELFGGSYLNCKSVRKPVQQQVLYCPNVDFIAFDLKVDDFYLSAKEAHDLFSKLNIPFVINDFIGSFEECLDFSASTNALQTSIPFKNFNLPQIENNIKEGNVIKPYDSVFYFTDKTRAIFKDKNKKFAEQNIVLKPREKIQKELLQDEIKEIKQYLVENRWHAIISKHGECTIQNKAKYISLFIQDAIEDYVKEKEVELFTLAKMKLLKNALFPLVFKFEFVQQQ